MKLFILTLVWKSEANLIKLVPTMNVAIDALKEYPGLESISWRIRDNASKDKSLDVLRDTYKHDIDILEAGHNKSNFSEGNNSLVTIANPSDDDMLLLLNDDTMITDPSSFNKMFDLQKKTKADVVGCRLLYMGTNKLQHAGVIFGKRYNNLPFHFRPSEESDANAEKDRYFQAVTAACCLVTMSSFKRLGGLNTNYLWCFDDIDYCLRVRASGGKVAYCGGTKIHHEESISLKKSGFSKIFMSQNVNTFKRDWTGKYTTDHEMYLRHPNHMVIV